MSTEPLRLLLLDGEPGWAPAVLAGLGSSGLVLERFTRVDDVKERLGGPESPDLVVVDLAIGERESHRFGSWLDQRPGGWPVLAISPAADEALRVELLESWADDVIAMPLAQREFVARCHALRRRRQLLLEQQKARTPHTHLRHGAITMHVEEHQVWRDGEPVQLTPREFRLLAYLLRHQGQIHDRDTLLERVWGEFSSLELDPKTVDVHIRWLRLKLEDDPAAPRLITTVRGRGYRLG